MQGGRTRWVNKVVGLSVDAVTVGYWTSNPNLQTPTENKGKKVCGAGWLNPKNLIISVFVVRVACSSYQQQLSRWCHSSSTNDVMKFNSGHFNQYRPRRKSLAAWVFVPVRCMLTANTEGFAVRRAEILRVFFAQCSKNEVILSVHIYSFYFPPVLASNCIVGVASWTRFESRTVGATSAGAMSLFVKSDVR